MAKIGNETRLVLKLAQERAKAESERANARAVGDATAEQKQYFAGMIAGIEWYYQELRNIALELERK